MFRVGKTVKRRLVCVWLLVFVTGVFPAGWSGPSPALGAESGSNLTYYGITDGGSLRQGVQFNDVGTGYWARDSIVRVASEGLLLGEGDGRFQPAKTLSRQEVIAGLIKAMGMEQEALLTTSVGAQADPWAQGFIAQAKTAGLVDDKQATLAWIEPVSRQEVAVWLAKALKLTPNYGGERRSLARFLDSGDIEAQAAPWVDPVVEQKLMEGVSDRAFDPQGGVTRAQLAVILDKADPILRPTRGITEQRGKIEGIDQITGFDQGYPVNQTQVRVANPDGGDILVFQSPQRMSDGRQAPLDRSAVVYSNASKRVGGTELLKAGQEVRYLTDSQDEVFFIEVMSQSSPQSVSGTIQEVNEAAGRLVINDEQGLPTIIPLGESVEVEVNGQPSSLSDLLYGQGAEVSLADGKAAAIKVSVPEPNPGYLPPEQQVRYGRVVEVGEDTLRLLEDGREVEYTFTPFTTFVRNNESIVAEQVRPGDMANVYLEDGLTPSALRPGQITADPLQAARVVLEGPAAQVVNIYRGILQEYLPASGNLVLKGAGEYHQGSGQYQQSNWINQKPLERFEVDSDTQVFVGGREISLRELKRPEYKGRRVYAATRNDYGEQQVVHLAVEPTLTSVFYDQIRRVNYGESWFRLSDVNLYDKRITWDDGTLVLHDGRLVGPSYLKEDQDIVVLASPFGSDYRASMVMVETPYYPSGPDVNSRKYLRFICGMIDDLSVDQIKLEDAYEWTKQERVSLGDEEYLSLSQETQVIDSTDGSSPATLIDLNELYTSWGSEDADNQYAYLIVYGNQVLAVNLRNGGSMPPTSVRFRAGRITSIKPGSSTSTRVDIVVDQVKDWVGISNYWQLDDSTSVSLDLDRAQVVRSGRPDQPTLLEFENGYNRLSVLKQGDQLYWLEVSSDDKDGADELSPVLVMAEPR
ncbi:MAG: S-layer homology domain-containing protein [Firmicutes bacterium]|nr:S-layer homology domain-containing protein [Bacillota bacterium]